MGHWLSTAGRLVAWLSRQIVSAGPWRTLAETVLVAVLLTLAVFTLDVSAVVHRQGLFFFVKPVAALWYAVRLRRPRGSILLQFAIECGLIVLAVLMLMLISLAAEPFTFRPDALTPQPNEEAWMLGDLFASTLSFVVLRGTFRVWLFWRRLQRRRLLWSLTNAHMMVVVLVSIVVILIAVIGMAQNGYLIGIATEQPSPAASLAAQVFAGVLPILGAMILFMLTAMAAILPPSALFSFLFARGTTRRLESLAQVTAAFRRGDYSARVAVKGEDEVARVQADFNAMADELQRVLVDLQVERDKVTALLQSQRQLFAGVSHELRTPVATTRGYLESLLANRENLPPGVCRDLEVIERENERLRRLIDDLFMLARIEAGGLRLTLTPVDVTALARRCAEAMAPLAWRAGRVEVIFHEQDHAVHAELDAERLEQIIYNLLRNAIRHTPPGGIVAVETAGEADAVTITVNDTGEGIAPDDLPHIWERFYRADAAVARDDSGAGLGLPIVKELAQAMGGAVAVHSVAGQGSRFTVRLPRIATQLRQSGDLPAT